MWLRAGPIAFALDIPVVRATVEVAFRVGKAPLAAAAETAGAFAVMAVGGIGLMSLSLSQAPCACQRQVRRFDHDGPGQAVLEAATLSVEEDQYVPREQRQRGQNEPCEADNAAAWFDAASASGDGRDLAAGSRVCGSTRHGTARSLSQSR